MPSILGSFFPGIPHGGPNRFFTAPTAGRKIMAGFSYLQRIGKGAQTRLWLPPDLDEQNIEWAAIRQFELLQEAGNLSIDDLEVSEIKRSFQAWSKMRAGGYRVTMLTLGRYTDASTRDDLEILDQKIQEEITRLIHFLYLSEQSTATSKQIARVIKEKHWHYEEALPHIAMTLGASHLFKPEKQSLAEQSFFKILEQIPSQHILHDIAIGLALPDASKEKNWTYIAKEEHRAGSFFAALGQSMGEMIHMQMRGHGDRLRPTFDAHYSSSSRWASGLTCYKAAA